MVIIIFVACGSGGMADAHGSGPCVGNNMRVQVPSSALSEKEKPKALSLRLFLFTHWGESSHPVGFPAETISFCRD